MKKISTTHAITTMITIVGFAIGSMVGAVASNSPSLQDDNILFLPEYDYHLKELVEDRHIYEAENESWEFQKLQAEIECLAENIYFEARGEDMQGQIAVGLVTINRVKSSKYPNTICDVVWQQTTSKQGKRVAQFSWTLDGLPDVPANQKAWDDSHRLAEAMIAEGSLDNFHDITNGSTHYHANYVSPFWSKKLEPTIVVGDHHFYKYPTVALTQ